MDVPVETALDKIREIENDKDKILQETREAEAIIASLTQSINENKKQTDRAQKELKLLVKKSEDTRIQLELARLQYAAKSTQVLNGKKLLSQLQSKMESSTSEMWKMRSAYSEISHDLIEKYDIWALMTKPRHHELLSSITDVYKEDKDDDIIAKNDEHLKRAMERREKVHSEILNLRKEPEMGEEFIRNYIQFVHRNQRHYCMKVTDENAPIKFSTSPAAKPSVIIPIKRDDKNAMPWYQPIVVVTSVAVFLIYFCILREENDIDLEFNKTLYDHIDGLEKIQLIQTYQLYKKEGKSVDEIEKRLKELEAKS